MENQQLFNSSNDSMMQMLDNSYVNISFVWDMINVPINCSSSLMPKMSEVSIYNGIDHRVCSLRERSNWKKR